MVKTDAIAYWLTLKTHIELSESQNENDYYYHETLQVCDRYFACRLCTKQRRFAKSLPICAVGASVYANAIRAFAR
jgi:hypothetical protein